jgi:hypothetical protein
MALYNGAPLTAAGSGPASPWHLTGDSDLEIIVGRGSDQVTVYNYLAG